MKKTTAFAAVLAATAVSGTSAAWASPVPATAGSHYAVTATATYSTSSAFTIACNPGDAVSFFEGSNASSTFGPSALDNTPSTPIQGVPAVASGGTDASGQLTALAFTFSGASAGDALTGTIYCLARTTVTSPNTSGPGGGY